MDIVRDMRRFEERREINSDVFMSRFQLLNEQRKQVSSALEFMKLHATNGGLERITGGGRKKGAKNYRRGKPNWVKDYIGSHDVDQTYPSGKLRHHFGIQRKLYNRLKKELITHRRDLLET